MPPTRVRERPQHGPSEPVQLDRVPDPAEVASIARRARLAWGASTTSRLDLGRVCERLGIEISVLAMGAAESGAQGFLVPTTGGRFRIEVDPEPSGGWQSVAPRLRKSLARHRERFLVAHELAHTLFYAKGPAEPRRLVLDSDRQETFCDDLARELLVPSEAAGGTPFTPDGVIELQRRFDVSMEVALRGLVAAHPEACVAWLLLQRAEKTLVQWTCAERALTSRMLPTLRTLSTRASEDGRAELYLAEQGHRAEALHLPWRRQTIVTWDRSAAGASRTA